MKKITDQQAVMHQTDYTKLVTYRYVYRPQKIVENRDQIKKQ